MSSSNKAIEREQDDNRIGGSISRSLVGRTKDKYRAIGDNDIRTTSVDVMDLSSLEDRYGAEFKKADAHMKTRKERETSSSRFEFLNGEAESDRTFLQWKQDQDQIRSRMGIHWIDEILEHPFVLVSSIARVTTTLGLAYGVGRGIYLYRTMDRTYARLHGVGFGSTVVHEISVGVLKGTGVAFAGAAGVSVGDSSVKLYKVMKSNDVAVPRREWENVVVGGVFAGLLMGGAFSAMHYTLLSGKGMAMATSAIGGLTSAIGWYYGKYVYRPFAEQRRHAHDDPYWRPWTERQLVRQGPRHIRGKYV